MKITVGTKNPSKVQAVVELLQEYPHLKDAAVAPKDVRSGVAEQPKSLHETIKGAMNRALYAEDDSNYSIGIESGLMKVPFTKSGYMDTCAAAIYDGKDFHLGLAPCWEFPDSSIMKLILEGNLDMVQAMVRARMTDDPELGSKQGAIGLLTKGRIDRKEYSKLALRMAFVHIDKHEFAKAGYV